MPKTVFGDVVVAAVTHGISFTYIMTDSSSLAAMRTLLADERSAEVRLRHQLSSTCLGALARLRAMTQNTTSAAQGCIFCAIVARQAEASVVYEDATVVVFMDLNPVTPGHLLVVPREHAVGLEDLDGATSAHVWSVGHDMARALRRSGMRCEGINVFLCDGEVAFQTVLHFHLHVIPRYAGDGWNIKPESKERERSLLDRDAQTIKEAIASTD